MPHANPTTTVAEAGTVQDAATRAADKIARLINGVMPNDATTLAAQRAWVQEMTDALSPVIAVEFAPLADEVERLRKVAESLPVTADGVTVYPGLKVWSIAPVTAEGRNDAYVYDLYINQVRAGGVYRHCYSTREAAAAALSPSAGEGEKP